jgi:hypothetical protein
VAVSFIGEETGVPRENHKPVTSHWQTLSHNVVLSTPRHESGVKEYKCTCSDNPDDVN